MSVRLALPDLKNTGRADMSPRSSMELLPENLRREFERLND
ncbi:hypothetical protein [Kingella kingae]|nr:hypothetical protein [Kingella kingae]